MARGSARHGDSNPAVFKFLCGQHPKIGWNLYSWWSNVQWFQGHRRGDRLLEIQICIFCPINLPQVVFTTCNLYTRTAVDARQASSPQLLKHSVCLRYFPHGNSRCRRVAACLISASAARVWFLRHSIGLFQSLQHVYLSVCLLCLQYDYKLQQVVCPHFVQPTQSVFSWYFQW